MIFLFINFPSTWDKIFSLATGLLIITIAIKLKAPEKTTLTGQVPYVEYKNTVKPRTEVTSEKKEQNTIDQNITNTDLPITS